MTDARLKLWIDFWKWFLSAIVVTGGIGITTALVSKKEKETQLELSILKEEKAYLTSFLDRALDNNLEQRRRFAQYFAALTITDSFRRGWKEYLTAIDEEVKQTRQQVDDITKSLPQKQGEELLEAKREIANLRTQIVISRGIGRSANASPVALDQLMATTSCPEKATQIVWVEPVQLSSSDWQNRDYIAIGCHARDGKKQGPWVAFHGNGKKAQAGSFRNDVRDGTTTTWYADGTKAAEWTWVDGQRGPERLWDAAGKPLK